MIVKTEKGTIKSDTEGMLLTDGETYGIEYLLGEGRSIDEFHEISREEYESRMQRGDTDVPIYVE